MIVSSMQPEAKKIGNEIYLFLWDKLELPNNREKRGICRPVNFKLLGHGFVPTYRKGEKGSLRILVNKFTHVI